MDERTPDVKEDPRLGALVPSPRKYLMAYAALFGGVVLLALVVLLAVRLLR